MKFSTIAAAGAVGFNIQKMKNHKRKIKESGRDHMEMILPDSQSDLNLRIVENGEMKELCKKYNPSLVYFNSLFGQVYGQLAKTKFRQNVDFVFQREYLENEDGKLVVDIASRKCEPADGKAKVLILLHGVTGSTKDGYMVDTTGEAVSCGIDVIGYNHYAPRGEKDLRLMNMCEDKHLDEVISFARSRFSDAEIYLCGFSLGGNHVLRYLGSTALKENEHVSRHVSGAIAVSNPFDVEATALKLRTTHFGIYDRKIAHSLFGAFKDKRFKNQENLITDQDLKKSPKWSVWAVDNCTRAIIWGYPGAHELYEETSCKGLLKHIRIPFMMILSKDDPVALDEDVPRQEILRN